MQEIRLRFDLTFSRRFVLGALTAAMVLAAAPELDSESVTLSTYYPAPSGVYTQMITTNNTFLARDGGNVGIGTTLPTQKLEVTGNIAASGQYQAPGGTDVTIAFNAANRLNVGGVMAVLGSGRVGIGTAVPSQNLDVTGNANVSNDLTVGGNFSSSFLTPTAASLLGPGNCTQTDYAITGVTLCPAGQFATLTSGVISKYTAMPVYGKAVAGDSGTGVMFCCTCPLGVCPAL